MKNFIKIYFLKIKKYLLNQEKFLVFLLFFLGIFIIFLANSEINEISATKPIYGGIYREGLYEEIESLNPVFPKNDSQKAILDIVFPPLVEFDNGRLISKYLKNYYSSSDGLTYNFELKDNLRWSDGSELTPEDIFFGLEVLKKDGPGEITAIFKDIQMEIIDKKKFIFKLVNNDNYFIYNLKYLKPLPQKIFTSNNLKFPDFLRIGSGPFVVDNFLKSDPISYLILKRNENYSVRAYLDKIIFYIYPNPKRAFDGLFLKEIDGLAGVNYFNLPSNLFFNYRVYQMVLPRVIGIFSNSKKVSVEEIVYLEKNINRNFLVKDIFKGYAEESPAIFSKTLRKVFNLKEIDFDFGKDETKEIATRTLITASSYFYPEIARYLRDKLNLKIEFVTNDMLKEIIKNKDYEMILTGLNFSHPPNLVSFFSISGLNLNNLENIDLEKNFQKIISDPKINWNEELLEIEKKILKLKTNVFLLNPAYLYFLNKNIYNFNEFYIIEPSARFVKIEQWFKR